MIHGLVHPGGLVRKVETDMSKEDELVLLGVAGSEVEAGMWNQALQSVGIKALVRPGGPGAGAWASAASFEHQVYVRADQLDDAQQVLQITAHDDRALPRARRAAPVVNRMRILKNS